ncbi:MAG: TFIIB-type zinc finger domain-containing protein [Rhodobacteraceae bacterium]|nr:TFIIB-type zinc finger domain-containing protein [Paracoccaceae bacterium]
MTDNALDDDLDTTPPADHRFPCDACGSDFRFDPDARKLVCDHCGNTAELDEIPQARAMEELDLQTALEGELADEEIEETRTVQCNSCGAQFDYDPAQHASECPFCATPVVSDTGPNKHIKPRGVLPFAVDEKAAREALQDWLGSLWFAPGGVDEYARKGRKMNGIYVPYWTFDADTKSQYTGARGKHYYVNQTVTRNGKTETRRVRKTRWRSVSGRVARFFDDVLVLASTSLPKKYTDRLSPWDLSDLRPYQPEYLAGFRAEAYTVELDQGFEEAKVIMNRQIERDVRFDIGGDAQRITTLKTQVRDVTFKHVLLPVWMAAYKYRGKTYRFVVNGRTGLVQGERPYSAWKIAFAVIVAAIIAGVAGYFIALNQ